MEIAWGSTPKILIFKESKWPFLTIFGPSLKSLVEAREWPELCKRGDTWPFEVIEFAQYSNSSDQSNNKEDENEEFDEESNAW